ncbi:hypothetical protein [Aquipuribacter sp. MA13-6]|uniref:hypothetical protein n=2 Tax=unclassified Aquipuribacter TaxID=2635084 RepID=UPI003EE89DD5
MRRSKIVLLLGVMVLAGCSGGGGSEEGLDLSTPPTAAPTTASATASAEPTGDLPAVEPTAPAETATPEEAAVLDAYRAFYAAVDEANADPQQSQVYLEPVSTGAQFEQTNGAIKADFLAGEVVVGSPVMDPRVASLGDGEAVVQDCQDTRGVILQDEETQEPLVVGQFPDSVQTTLTLVDGAWKVSATEYTDDPGVFCE